MSATEAQDNISFRRCIVFASLWAMVARDEWSMSGDVRPIAAREHRADQFRVPEAELSERVIFSPEPLLSMYPRYVIIRVVYTWQRG